MKLTKFIIGFAVLPGLVLIAFTTLIIPILLFGPDTGLLVIGDIYLLGFSVTFGYWYAKE